MASFILTAAIRAVKSKIGVQRAYESVSRLAPEVTQQEWSQAIGEAKAALSQRVDEWTRPLNRRPVSGEITTLERKSSVKYWQQVEIYIRDKETGARSVMHFYTRTDTLRSRISVVNDWIKHVQGMIDSRPKDYPIDIVGFAYTGTYEIRPPRGK